MDVKITPTKLKGSVVIPPSKSLAHRAIICACLSRGKSVISNVALSDDIIATIGCMRNLGAKIDIKDGVLEIDGNSGKILDDLTFDCKESGSTLRFILPIALALNEGNNAFVGRGKLGERPMKIYGDICKEQGIEYIDRSLANDKHLLDLSVNGELKSGEFHIDGGVSSQFITGLLFALPLLDGDSKIIIEGDLQSIGYLDLTLFMLNKFGISIDNKGYKVLQIKGGQRYMACDYYIEGDYSQSAFYEVARYLGNDVTMLGLNVDSLQGDKVIVDFVNRLRTADASEKLTFDGSNCPDIIPVFALACCLRKGHTDIINISRLRIKECDRLSATAEELGKLGAKIAQGEDSLSIDGVDKLSSGEVDSHNDHRMAMTLAIASTVTDGEVTISNAQSVSKSYPNFFDHFVSLGGKVKYKNI
ncbi:MAG: 3-phosphoshikimate 1-carboxyvinyltransferase [Clostridia bacterium]|nr:3-phosphoshikimate 1-carboxyvinyltransferase [Clostridia bacterium]